MCSMAWNPTSDHSLDTKVEQIKEKARELASLPDEDFHQLELQQLQTTDCIPNASVESVQSVNSLPTSCTNSKLATPEPNNPGDTTAPIPRDEPTLVDHCQPDEVCVHLEHKKSSLDLKNSLDLNARERTKPGPHFVASEPSEISFGLGCEGSDGDDNRNHMTYSKVSFANHGEYKNQLNYTSDESTDSLTFRERSLSVDSDSGSSYPSYHELCSEGLTTSAKLSERNRQSQQSRYRQSSFALVTDVKKNPKVDLENEQVKNIPENTRKRKKKKKKGKVAKMDDDSKSGKTTNTDVSTGIVFDVFTPNNVKKAKNVVDRKPTSTEETLLNECGLKKIDNNEVEIRMDAIKNNRKQDTAILSDSDELKEIVIMDKIPVKKCTETSSLRSDDTSNRRRYDTFGPRYEPPFEYPPNTDKLTNTAMSLIDDRHKGSRDIEMQIMSSSLETPIQEDPRRRVQYITSATAGTINSLRDLKSILKSTSNSVCDDNAKIPAASVKERFDDIDMRSLSNNHYILSDELAGDTDGNKKKKKSKKKKKKDEDTAEEDSTVREPERKLKSALAPRKDTFMDSLRDYPNNQDNEPYLTADGIRNIDKLGSKNCRKKREITTTAPPSIINNRSPYSQGRNQKCEDIKKRLQEKLNAKSHDSAIDRHCDTNLRMEYHSIGTNINRLNTDNNKRQKNPQDGGKKSSVTVKEENEFGWITDPEALTMFGLTTNNNKDKKNPKKKKKTVDDKKDVSNEDVTHSDSEVKELKAKDCNVHLQTKMLRKSASFDTEENASSSEEENNEKEFQIVQSKKKKAAKKRVIFEDKSASFPRNMVPTYPKEKSSYLASGNLRKCKSEPNNMTLVQDDVEAASFGGTGTSSGSQSSASSISTDPPSSQSYLEMAVVSQPTPNAEPTPQFEFSYASKVKGASPKNEQTIANKLATESNMNPVDSSKDCDNEGIDSVAELAGESTTTVQCTEEANIKPAKEIVTKPRRTNSTFSNKPMDMKSDNAKVDRNSGISAADKSDIEEVSCNPIKKGDKKKEICSDVLVNGIDTELINSVGDKSSKLPGVNADAVGIGITFGSIVFHNDNSFSLEDNDERPVRGSPTFSSPAPGSPVDQLMASAQNATYPTEPSTVITCTALENSLVRENSEASKRKLVKEVIAVNNIGSFNHFTIAKFLQKEWEKVLEEAATNPGCVVYH